MAYIYILGRVKDWNYKGLRPEIHVCNLILDLLLKQLTENLIQEKRKRATNTNIRVMDYYEDQNHLTSECQENTWTNL